LSDPVAQHLPEFEDIQVTTHIGGHSAQHRPAPGANRAGSAAPHRWPDLRDFGQ
jgi:hypothetical protein